MTQSNRNTNGFKQTGFNQTHITEQSETMLESHRSKGAAGNSPPHNRLVVDSQQQQQPGYDTARSRVSGAGGGSSSNQQRAKMTRLNQISVQVSHKQSSDQLYDAIESARVKECKQLQKKLTAQGGFEQASVAAVTSKLSCNASREEIFPGVLASD